MGKVRYLCGVRVVSPVSRGGSRADRFGFRSFLQHPVVVPGILMGLELFVVLLLIGGVAQTAVQVVNNSGPVTHVSPRSAREQCSYSLGTKMCELKPFYM